MDLRQDTRLLCPECAHGYKIRRGALTHWIDRLLRIRPGCNDVETMDASGWSSPCACRHPWHTAGT